MQKNMVMWRQPKSSTTKTTYTVKNPNTYRDDIKVEGNSVTKDSQGSMQVIPYSEEVQWIEQKYTCDREMSLEERCDKGKGGDYCSLLAMEF